MKALKMRSTVAGHRKLTATIWEPSSKLILLKLHRKLTKNSVSTSLWLFGIWSKLERWKSSIKWVPPKLTESQKNRCFEVSPSLTYATMSHFLIGSWRAMTNVFCTTASDHLLSSWTEKKLQSTSQNQACTQKWSWSLGWAAAGLSHYSFLNPSKILPSEKCAPQVDEMRWKIQQPQLALGNRKGPVFLHDSAWRKPHITQPMLQKLNE